jgi:hypothetical protein
VTLNGGSAAASTSGGVPLLAVLEDLQERARELEDLEAGAYTRPLSSST